ncbi:MAG: hypothetical protein M0Q23_05920 [Syntrophales bacterium]|nr:hypothetical protein [Syntrophales bacterium]MCK9528172.1 hypothetical protein [Syntrophales bacterium]MDX9921142.1 hypothetical protein [Syntrophales bacterium]
MKQENAISPDTLLSYMGTTAADNVMGLTTALPWMSMMGGYQAKTLFDYQKVLASISECPALFGPFSILAGFQNAFLETLVLDPLKAHARLSTRSGRDPDIYRDINGWIYKNYTRLIWFLCDYFVRDGRFDRDRARFVATTPEGHAMLKEYLQEFGQMERAYTSAGMTRLNAMKELLTCLLVVITERPLKGRDMPFMRKNSDGSDAMTFEEYLAENRLRLETLHRYNAFDLKEYSERATLGVLGCSDYEVVEGSRLAHVSLRRYTRPEDVKPVGKVIYMSTPLINKPELFDLADGKSVVQAMLREGYDIYMVDFGTPGPEDNDRGLDFYGKTVHDHNFNIIRKNHPRAEIIVLGYCMGGTLILPYLARRAEERLAAGKKMDVRKVALLAAPVLFDDDASGHGPMRSYIRRYYDEYLMTELFGSVNVPPHIIEFGMNEIQPGVHYTVMMGFYGRAISGDAVEDAAPFLYWLTHGTRFPARAHREWIRLFLTNPIVEGTFRLPSTNRTYDGKPVDMEILRTAGIQIFDYRGLRDPIAPPGSCVASELWGQIDDGNIRVTRNGLNRTLEKNIGHIFVVSRTLLAEYLRALNSFLNDEPFDGTDR